MTLTNPFTIYTTTKTCPRIKTNKMDAQLALAELQTPKDLSIVALAEPYFTAQDSAISTNQRSSNASSTEGREGATPAILAADLTHYQELFSKLRFSYVEQVTKERFLRAITADQPEFVDASENVELEEKLKGDKAALKERKEEVRELVKELEEQGRQLAASMLIANNMQWKSLIWIPRIRYHPTPKDATISLTLINQEPRVHNHTAPTIPTRPTHQPSALNAPPTHPRHSQRTRRSAYGHRSTDRCAKGDTTA